MIIMWMNLDDVDVGGKSLTYYFVHHYAGGNRNIERAYLSKHRDGYECVTQSDDLGINACVLGTHYDGYRTGIIGAGIVYVGFFADGYYFISIVKEKPYSPFYRSLAAHGDVVECYGRSLDCMASDTHAAAFG